VLLLSQFTTCRQQQNEPSDRQFPVQIHQCLLSNQQVCNINPLLVVVVSACSIHKAATPHFFCVLLLPHGVLMLSSRSFLDHKSHSPPLGGPPPRAKRQSAPLELFLPHLVASPKRMIAPLPKLIQSALSTRLRAFAIDISRLNSHWCF